MRKLFLTFSFWFMASVNAATTITPGVCTYAWEIDIPAQSGWTASTNFPCLLTVACISASGICGSSGQCSQSNGGDICFSSAAFGGTQYPCEIVNYTVNATPASATVEIWVGVPLTTSATKIFMNWTNSGTSATTYAQPTAGTATVGSQAVWDTNYTAVYHFGTSGSLVLTDSTATGATLTNGSCTATAGQVSGAIAGNGSQDAYTAAKSLVSSTGFTVESWIKSQTSSKSIFSHSNASTPSSTADFELYCISSTPYFYVYSGASGYAARASGAGAFGSSWTHFAGIFRGSDQHLDVYISGALNNGSLSGTIPATCNTPSSPLWLFSEYNGTYEAASNLDEFRVSNIARDAKWILAAYNSQNSPTTFMVLTGSLLMPAKAAGKGCPFRFVGH